MCEWGKGVREERYQGIESRGTIHVLPKPLGNSKAFSGWLHPAFCSVLNIRWQSLHLITSPKLVIWISIDRPWTHLPREHSSTQGRKGSSPSTLCMSFRKPEARISSSTGKEVTLQIARSHVPVSCFALEAMWQQQDKPPGTDAVTLCPHCHPASAQQDAGGWQHGGCWGQGSWERDVKTEDGLGGRKFADRWNGSAVLEGIMERQLFWFPPPSYINESKPELFWVGADDDSLKCTGSAVVVPALIFFLLSLSLHFALPV